MEKQYESHDTNTNTNLPIIYIYLIAMSLKFSSICVSIYSLIRLISFLKTFIKEKTILFTNCLSNIQRFWAWSTY